MVYSIDLDFSISIMPRFFLENVDFSKKKWSFLLFSKEGFSWILDLKEENVDISEERKEVKSSRKRRKIGSPAKDDGASPMKKVKIGENCEEKGEIQEETQESEEMRTRKHGTPRKIENSRIFLSNTRKLDKEKFTDSIFSNCVFIGQWIVVGCRDDKVHSFKY